MDGNSDLVAGIRAHASLRWSRIVAAPMTSPEDVRTLEAWAWTVGVSRGALRAWCHAAGELPRCSLDLARALRGVALGRRLGWDPWNLFDIVDPRTMHAFLGRCGMSADAPPVSAIEFCAQVPLIRHEHNRRALLAVVRDVSLACLGASLSESEPVSGRVRER